MLQHFSAHGLYLGSRQIPPFRPGTFGMESPRSLAYFCQSCGETWAKVKNEGTSLWFVRYRTCLECGDGTLSSAPHWKEDQAQFADDWPPAAIEWEFKCLLARAEKELAA